MSVFSRITGQIAGAAMIAAIVGCGSDLGVGPHSESLPDLKKGRGGEAKAYEEKQETEFVLDPSKGGTFRIGKLHSIEFERDAVCDPRRSTYGVGEWDKPCAPLRRRITITVESRFGEGGHPHVKFEPELRFAPGRTVTLSLFDSQLELDDSYKILYCGSGISDGSCIDESLSDASLATYRDPRGHFLYRRIKHFSAFYVGAD
jgi:hypothetical protein